MYYFINNLIYNHMKAKVILLSIFSSQHKNLLV
jgi:hypothetical protein